MTGAGFCIRWRALTAGLLILATTGVGSANVSPVTLIERQVHKPNFLIVLDTSGSMGFAPGSDEDVGSDMGMDCDGDVWCRQDGYRSKCVLRSAACTTTSDCSAGYCMESGGTTCSTDSQCTAGGEYCDTVPNDRCITTTGLVRRGKVCAIGLNRCWDNSDCTANAGDTCGPGISRMVVAKRVLASVVGDFYSTVNFGLMTYYQNNYYPYYPISGSYTYTTTERYLDKDQLDAAGCWNKTTGPASSCTIGGVAYTRRTTNNSRYRIKTGGSTYNLTDNDWCGFFCSALTVSGTGHYVGSYYTYSNPTAALATTTASTSATYRGKALTSGGVNYLYWDVPDSLYCQNGQYGQTRGCATCALGSAIPIGNFGAGACSATTGGRWDANMVPFMDTTDTVAASQNMALNIMARMDKARFGGLAAAGGTPIGCTLWNNYSGASKANSALHYMRDVKTADTLACRRNHVLLVTDGAPYTTPDLSCHVAACAAADPAAAGCTCHAVLAAKKLKDEGFRTYVVGFAAAFSGVAGASGVNSRATLNNIAKAGGTIAALFATHENDLRDKIVSAIYDGAKGSYTTSPATTSSGVQRDSGTTMGTMLLDSRVDFPSWKGNLIAYDVSGTTPTVAWNAATVAFDYNVTTGEYFTSTTPVDRRGDWRKRNVWTSSGTTMVKIDVNQTTGAINNASTLRSLGLGDSDAEAALAARWMLGDPALKNPAVLGALVNSTPTDIGPPGKNAFPGSYAFYNRHKDRPFLAYVGSSDGMLHAFFTKDVTVGGVSYRAGQEAFAYMPQTFLGVTARLFAQGGQLPDPRDHIYGLANSPKVKDVCIENCTNAATAVWKSVLAMSYGFGGTEAFTLDITNPFDGYGVKISSAPAPLIWSTQYLSPSQTSTYDNALGLTTSVPGFSYGKGTSKDDYRLTFGSYYTDGEGRTAKVLLTTKVNNGDVLDAENISPGNSCTGQEYGLLSDVATARNYAANEEDQILAAYFGDTWGNLYRYRPHVESNNETGAAGTASLIEAYGCSHPIHFAPTIVQLDRETDTTRPGEIYIVQVTNSALDPDTKDLPASKMIFIRDIANTATGAVTADSSFQRVELTAGTSGLCGVTNAAGTSCITTLPEKARPSATPSAILRGDGTGFQVMATWYVPAADGCNKGASYLTIHEVLTTTGAVTQRFALQLASEPVTSAVFVGAKLLYATEAGLTDLTPRLPSTMQFRLTQGAAGYRRTGWTELP
jgi:hypothetical protein